VYHYIRDVWLSSADPNALSLFMSELEPGVGGSFDNRFFMEQYVAAINESADIPIAAADISRWDIRAIRTCYYSDFYPAPDWQDNWQTVWLITIHFCRPLTRQLFDEEPATIALGDPQFAGSFGGRALQVRRDDAIPCLVISKLPKTASPQAIQRALELETGAASISPITFQHAGFKQYAHVHIGLGDRGPTFYRDGAVDAQRIIDVCGRFGGIENCKTLSLKVPQADHRE
jgi:hypothetical protein